MSDELLIPLGLGKHWSCTEMRSFFAAKGKVNHDYKTAEVGDIILYDWDKSGDCDHVGIVVENRGNELAIIEGNTCDDNYLETCVALKTYSVNYQYFSCIIDMSDYMTDEPTSTSKLVPVRLTIGGEVVYDGFVDLAKFN